MAGRSDAVMIGFAALLVLCALPLVSTSTDAASPPLVGVVITFSDFPSPTHQEAVRSLSADVVHEFELIPAVATLVAEDRLQMLRSIPNVRGVYLDSSEFTSHNETAAFNATAIRDMHGLSGANVTVAVIDTGIDATHPAFAGRIAEKVLVSWAPGVGLVLSTAFQNYLTDDHGTHVAGIVGGSGAGSPDGHVGVAPGVSFVDVTTHAETDTRAQIGPKHIGEVSNKVKAIEWVAANRERLGIRVVQMSWGDVYGNNLPVPGEERCEDHPLSQAVMAADHPSLVWVSTPTDTGGPREILAPGCLPRVLSVGAAHMNGTTADFSGRGPTIEGYPKPDVTAPGVDIVSAVPLYTGQSYAAKSGTSMAAPYISGLAALLLEAEPSLSGIEVQDRITRAASHWPSWNADDGFGYVDAARVFSFPATPPKESLSSPALAASPTDSAQAEAPPGSVASHDAQSTSGAGAVAVAAALVAAFTLMRRR